jgi:hypothetical protein
MNAMFMDYFVGFQTCLGVNYWANLARDFEYSPRHT